MSPLNPIFSLIIYAIAFLTAYLIKLNFKVKSLNGRYESIDGMRGFLALGVFIHHSCIWHQFIQTGIWGAPKSNLYDQFGQTSVALFFMITSFLFISKLLNSSEKGFNWRSFFLSRIFRLVPMYYFSLCLIIITITFISHWHLNVELSELYKSIFNWLFFTIYDTPNINNSAFTSYINAGVVQTLPYEWLFYVSLPLVSILFLKIKPKTGYIILAVVFIIMFYIMHGVYEYYIYSFMGGAIAPILIKFNRLIKVNDTAASVIILICLVLIIQFSSAVSVIGILLLTIVFTQVASGASLFGLLKNSTLKFLGTISYSTYLLHGILLFTVYYFGFGFEKLKVLTPFEYCLVVFSLTPTLLLISFLGFKYIEQPNIDRAKIIAQKLTKSSKIHAL